MTSEPEHESLTPEIDAILSDLADLCLASVRDSESFDDDRARKLVESLNRNGWDRHSNKQKPLRDQLRDRIFASLPESTHPRRSELDGLLGRIQSLYASVSHFDTKLPVEDQRPGKDPHNQAAPPKTTLQGE